jgi:hypothetical protein
MFKTTFFGLTTLAVTATAGARAQGVLIAPQAIIVNESSGGTLTIINPARGRVEIALSTLYGYPVTDERGALRLRTFEAVDDTMPSAAGWITAYPRRFTLDEGQRQTVRLVVSAPGSVAPGEYWARLVVSSKGAVAATPVAVADTSAPVSMSLNLEVRSVLPVLYRRGAVATGLTIDAVQTGLERDSLAVVPTFQRQGNAAWVGTVGLILRDAANAEVRRLDMPLAVYYQLAPRFALPTTGLAPGRYSLEVSAVAQRADLPRNQVLASPARVHRTDVRIP